MLKLVGLRLVFLVVVSLGLVGCGSSGSDDNADSGAGGDPVVVEEMGAGLALGDQFDGVAGGVRLQLEYNAGTNGFVGSITNNSGGVLERVEVVVTLDNAASDGLVLPSFLEVNFAVDEMLAVSIPAASAQFSTWDVLLRVE